MATTQDYIEYVCEQLDGAGDIRYKKCLVNIWFILMKSQL